MGKKQGRRAFAGDFPLHLVRHVLRIAADQIFFDSRSQALPQCLIQNSPVLLEGRRSSGGPNLLLFTRGFLLVKMDERIVHHFWVGEVSEKATRWLCCCMICLNVKPCHGKSLNWNFHNIYELRLYKLILYILNLLAYVLGAYRFLEDDTKMPGFKVV
jgi:hypothetical protein